MTGSYDSKVIGDRFQLRRAPTVLARTASVAPIGFTRLQCDEAGDMRAQDVPFERAFALHIALQPVSADLWVDGRHSLTTKAKPGDAFLFDLSANPVSELHGSFDLLRFYISQASLDELAFDRGARGVVQLVPRLGGNDRVMHGLAMALIDSVERPAERSTLFIDHIGLAFHAHVTDAYGEQRVPAARDTGGLAPWQLRRALDYMRAHLAGDPTIGQLAQLCGLSGSYFARAFRRTQGSTPHQWLLRRRVERARELLLAGDLDLAGIAVTCGFVDQSHLSRVFTRFEGESPGRWRRRYQ